MAPFPRVRAKCPCIHNEHHDEKQVEEHTGRPPPDVVAHGLHSLGHLFPGLVKLLSQLAATDLEGDDEDEHPQKRVGTAVGCAGNNHDGQESHEEEN